MCYHAILFGIYKKKNPYMHRKCLQIIIRTPKKKNNKHIHLYKIGFSNWILCYFLLSTCFIFLCTFIYRRLTPLFFIYIFFSFVFLFLFVNFPSLKLLILYFCCLVLHYYEIATYIWFRLHHMFSFYTDFKPIYWTFCLFWRYSNINYCIYFQSCHS